MPRAIDHFVRYGVREGTLAAERQGDCNGGGVESLPAEPVLGIGLERLVLVVDGSGRGAVWIREVHDRIHRSWLNRYLEQAR